MSGLPVLLQVEGRRCLVVGGGKVGTRKARQLYEAGAQVTILSSSLHEPVEGIHWEPARYSSAFLLAQRPFLVIAATNDPAANTQIGVDAADAGILCLRADEAGAGDAVSLMARDLDGILVAISSGSPLLSRGLLDLFEQQITPQTLQFAKWLRVLRAHAKEHIPTQAERAALWTRVFEAGVLETLHNGDEAAAKARLKSIVGAELAKYL